jgi:endonuclease YncB( thermonuclease family)
MRRRSFLGALGTTIGAASISDELVGRARAATELDGLEFASTSSLLNANKNPLTDDSLVAVWAEDTATNNDADGDGAVSYPDDTSIPLVASENGVVGFGSMLVTDDANVQQGNEEFVLNVWDAEVGGGTVLWDEGHGQYYDLTQFTAFESYAENNGYSVEGTSNLSADLGRADAVVITSPGSAFTQSELNDLQNFVANGGTIFLHDQSDYNGYDQTQNLNDIPAALGSSFRFNDDEVLDTIYNGGSDYLVRTDQFNTTFPYFSDRAGLGLDPEKTYTVPVDEVLDGDTVKITIDGTQESIRVLGIDTAEKASNQQYERVQEWEGIESLDYLATWGSNATTFAKDELSGKTIDVAFDSNEPVRDPFGRLLAYIYYDATGDGSRDTLYNLETVKQGYARLYDSSFAKHETFFDADAAARANGTGVWAQADPNASSEIRNRDVSEVFFPKSASVCTSAGRIDQSRVPVSAESTASQTLETGGVSDSEVPLVGVDDANSVAVVGAPLIDESYESAEGFAVDTSTYENFVFLTNLLNSLSDNAGDVLIDGGHGQFGASFGLSAEDTAYYMRFLEGVDIGLEGVNTITTSNLSGARALIVTTPAQSFSQSEIDAINTYVSNGGAVVLVGTGVTSAEARGYLNDLASGLGTDLRLNADRVRDSSANVNGDSGIPVTTNFDTSFDLFTAIDGGSDDGGSGGEISIGTINYDAAGDDGDNLNDEYVVFENTGSSATDLTDWQVSDEAGKTYTFPSFTLDAGSSVTLHTGSGTDAATDLYWGYGTPVWNNGGDTVTLTDDTGAVVAEQTYPESSSSGMLSVAEINADAAGNDTNNLNDEYVVFENTGDASLDLTDWQVQDEVEKTYTFPSFTLDAGAQVTLRTGTGTDTSTDLYWGRTGSAVWNNGGDTVFVYDDTGTLVIEEPY